MKPQKKQEPEDLFETISQALMNAVDRDALSGWGATVHVMWVLFRCEEVGEGGDRSCLSLCVCVCVAPGME